MIEALACSSGTEDCAKCSPLPTGAATGQRQAVAPVVRAVGPD